MAKVSKKFKRFSQQSLFLLLAFIMVVLVGILVIWSVIYLGESFNTALTVPPTPPPQVQFDIQGFQNLHLNQ